MSQIEFERTTVNWKNIRIIVVVTVLIAVICFVSINPVTVYLKKSFWERHFTSVSDTFTVDASMTSLGSLVRVTTESHVPMKVLSSVLQTFLTEHNSNPDSVAGADRFMVNFGSCDDGRQCLGFEFASEDLTEENVADALSVYSLIEPGDSIEDFSVVFATDSPETTTDDNSKQVIFFFKDFNVERLMKAVEVKETLSTPSAFMLFGNGHGTTPRMIYNMGDVDSDVNVNKDVVQATSELIDVFPSECIFTYDDTAGINLNSCSSMMEDEEVRVKVEQVKSDFPNVRIKD